MPILKAFILFLVLGPLPAWAVAGHVSVASQNNLKNTVDLLKAKAPTFGFKVVLIVDHAKSAAVEKAGTVLLLDHSKHEAPLLALSETIGIDLPLKVLAFTDKAGQVWMTYADPRSIAARHRISDSREAEKLADALSSLTLVAATGKK